MRWGKNCEVKMECVIITQKTKQTITHLNSMDSIMRIFTKSTCFSFIPNLFKNFALSVILSRAGFYKTKGLKVVILFVEAISSIITAKTTYAYIRQGKTAEAESLFKSPAICSIFVHSFLFLPDHKFLL